MGKSAPRKGRKVPGWAEALKRPAVAFVDEPTEFQRRILEADSFLIANCGRQVGKSTAAAMKAVLVCMQPLKTVLIVSASQKQATELLRKCKRYAPEELIERDTATEIEFQNGSRIISLPCREATIRGYTADFVIVDEAARIPDEVYYGAIAPMVAVRKGYIHFYSTPFGKQGFFWRLVRDGTYPVLEITSYEGGLISMDFLEEEKKRLPPEYFAQEYEHQFIDFEASIFPPDIVNTCIANEVPPSDCVRYAGIDLGRLKDSTVIVVYRDDGFVEYTGEMMGEPWAIIKQFLIDTIKRYNVKKAVIELNHVGDVISEDLMRALPGRVEGFVTTRASKIEIITKLRALMVEGKVRFVENRRLMYQLLDFSFREGGKMEASPGRHDDYVMALAMACHAKYSTSFSKIEMPMPVAGTEKNISKEIKTIGDRHEVLDVWEEERT